MGWSIGYDSNWERDIGYGVPTICDHPECNKEIDRGLSFVCGDELYGGDDGCGLFFCGEHKEYKAISDVTAVQICHQCRFHQPSFTPKPDTKEWREWKKTDGSWGRWRQENPELAAAL